MSKIKSSPIVSYDSRLSVVVPVTLHDEITKAARSSLQPINAWVRGACLERPRREGVAPVPQEAA